MMTSDKRRALRSLLLTTSTLALIAASGVHAGVLPAGGAVTSGTAGIASTSTQVTVSQSSAKAIVTWSGFSIGQGNTVQFNNGTGSTLNRVTGSSASAIDGALNATGSVYLINQHGIVIGKTGVVNVGGSFVASTLDIPDTSYLAGGALTFSGPSTASLINLGQIGASGGDVALIAQTVENDGTITAASGDVGLLAGSQVSLSDTLSAGGKFQVTLGSGTSATNTGTIQAAIAELRAYGGNVYALAGNTGGSITATGVSANDGQVFLTANAPSGATGVGDVTISGGVSFSGGANALTIDAFRNANILTAISTTGGHVTLTADDGGVGGDYSFGLGPTGFAGSLSFLGGAGSGESLTINGQAYTLLYSIAGFAALNDNTSGQDFALAQSLDAGGIAFGFSAVTDFGGTFTGLGHTIANVSISTPFDSDAGFFDDLYGNARDFGLVGGSVFSGGISGFASGGTVGSLAGVLYGSISNTYSTASVSGGSSAYQDVGGLVGFNLGSISNSYSAGAVGTAKAVAVTGGLVGSNNGSISNAYVTGLVTGAGEVGGLAGFNYGGSISNAYVTGSVTGASEVGGLVAFNHDGAITNAYVTGSVTGVSEVGGLVGFNDGGTISNAYVTGPVSGVSEVGALVGQQYATATNTYTNLYYDDQTTGHFGSVQLGGVGLTTATLQGASPAGFDLSVWGAGPGLYPYLRAFYSKPPQAISGVAYNSNLTVDPGVQVGLYSAGALLNGGYVSTGANGYFYELVAADTVDKTTKLGETIMLNGAPGVSGLSYTDQPLLISGNVVTLNVNSGSASYTTGETTLSALNGDAAATFGGGYGAIVSQLSGTARSIVATNPTGFDIDRQLNLGAGALTINADGAVTQSLNSVIWSAGLSGSSIGGASLTASNNRLGTFSWTNIGAGDVTLDDSAAVTLNVVNAGSGDLTIGGPLSYRIYDTGPLTAGGNISLSASHGIDISGQITAGGAVALTGSSVGGVAEEGSGAISAASLGGTANMLILKGANAVGTITGFSTTGGFLFNDTQALDVSGPIAGGSGLLYLTSGGGLIIDGALTSTGNMVLRANGDIAIDAGLSTGGNLVLNATGAISETGSITAGALLGYSAGSTSLSGSNHSTPWRATKSITAARRSPCRTWRL